MTNDNKLTVLQMKPKNTAALEVAKQLVARIEASPDTEELIAFTRTGHDYHRMSTDMKVDNFIATLEMIKFDALLRMRE
jgi:hypothetical protein